MYTFLGFMSPFHLQHYFPYVIHKNIYVYIYIIKKTIYIISPYIYTLEGMTYVNILIYIYEKTPLEFFFFTSFVFFNINSF